MLGKRKFCRVVAKSMTNSGASMWVSDYARREIKIAAANNDMRLRDVVDTFAAMLADGRLDIRTEFYEYSKAHEETSDVSSD